MLTRIGVAVLGLFAASACDKPQPSPMADMPMPTEARVRAAAQVAEREADRWVVRDSIVSTEDLDSLLTLVAAPGQWRVVDDDAPLGYLGIALRRNNTLVGNLRVGDSWLLVLTDYSTNRKPRLRKLSATELASVHRWLRATQGNH